MGLRYHGELLRVVKRALFATIVLLGLLGLHEVPVTAVDLRDVLTGYTFTSWTRKDGLAGPVWAIAQDGQGFLWLGTDDGLFRFDGVRFVTWESLGGATLPKAPVRALLVAHDGTMWVGFGATGAIAHLDGKAVRLHDKLAGGEIGLVAAFAEDRDRVLWAAAGSGLLRLNDDRWQRVGAPEGLPDVGATSLLAGPSGELWVGTAAGLYSRTDPGVLRFQQIEDALDPIRAFALSRDPSGALWTSDPLVGFRPLTRPLPVRGGQAGRGYRLMHDRNGNLWVGTLGQGLWRIKAAAAGATDTKFERATVLSGLASDAVRSLFEDRDGNIWSGSIEGIDRLVPYRITPWSGLGLVDTIAATPDGHVVVGTEEEILRFSRSTDGWTPAAERITIRGVRSLRADSRGHIWASTADDVFAVEGVTTNRRRFPAGVRPSAIEAIASDPRGGLWVIVGDGVVLRDDGTGLSLYKRIEALSTSRVTAAAGDYAGRLWVLFEDTRAGVLEADGSFRAFGPGQGLSASLHYAIHQSTDGRIWIAGAEGVSRFEDGRFSSMTRANGLPAGVQVLNDDAEGNLWLATGIGLIRVAVSEYDLAAANPSYQVRFRIFDAFDGLAGMPVLLGDSHPARASDGTMWFVTSRGLSIADPLAFVAPRAPTRITIDEVRANDRPVTGETLPSGTTKVQFEYTTPDLTYPFKPRFRYRLDGFDTDWIDAGRRRDALYTNLPPSRFTFRVAVSSDDGRWSEVEIPRTFSIAPRFYQTWWFYPLCGLTAVAMVAAAWRLRLRQLRRQFSLVLGERVRLSRELHDTLLQSLVGVALEFDAVSKTLDSSPATARERVIKIREHVEEYIREARRSIWSLRSQALETGDLLVALRESAERATEGQDLALEFSVTGTPRRPPSSVEHQLLRIGQEAVLNAVRHASARHVRMNVTFTDDDIVLDISDDGRGFDPHRAAEGTTDHYGLTTMQERAQQCGGRVTVTSEPGRGTMIHAVVPAPADALEAVAP